MKKIIKKILSGMLMAAVIAGGTSMVANATVNNMTTVFLTSFKTDKNSNKTKLMKYVEYDEDRRPDAIGIDMNSKKLQTAGKSHALYVAACRTPGIETAQIGHQTKYFSKTNEFKMYSWNVQKVAKVTTAYYYGSINHKYTGHSYERALDVTSQIWEAVY